MRTFLIRRLLQIVPLLFGISALTFLLLKLAPGDFLATMAENPQISAATAAFRYMAVNSAAGVIATTPPSAPSIAARYSSGEGALDLTDSPFASVA